MSLRCQVCSWENLEPAETETQNWESTPIVVGVDLIEITRVKRVLTRYGDRFLARVFTPAEIRYCRGRLPELAVRFAAKEAVSKALGVGMRIIARDGIDWRDVEVIGDRRGKPLVHL